MAQEHAGPQTKAPWTKIFTAFKVALDLKKLLLAAAGILITSCGWLLLAWIFFSMHSKPEWAAYEPNNKDATAEDRQSKWADFSASRRSWNLLLALAGPPSEKVPEDAGDVAKDSNEFTILDSWDKAYRGSTKTLAQIKAEGANYPEALAKFEAHLLVPHIKPSGQLRTLPWNEYRGPNPYRIVADSIKSGHAVAGAGSRPATVIHWLVFDEAPVLLEPLYKFLRPVAYLFSPDAGIWIRLYLILVTLWTLAVWGFFGGAICRLAAVQVARNERITLTEAILFTKERYVSFLVAPIFPMVLIAILALVLIVFGWFEWIPYLGDIFAGLFWPVVLILGFIMTIVLVGLVGWPMMNATISTEGSDSFDALSRSYSYVYQAPWQYAWYSLLAIVYGAVLVFFVGFMASSLVFLGKWGVSNAPGLAKADPKYDREPSYLFIYAPTSFGWRDLMISSSRFAKSTEAVTPSGEIVKHWEFTEEYENSLGFFNRLGAGLVAIWIGLLFLLVVGFGYSYFWTVSTIIYFLMRHYVDDTDLDEVHMEDEGLEDPFLKPPPSAPEAAAPPAKPGTISLTVVEASVSPVVPATPPASEVTAWSAPPHIERAPAPPVIETPSAPLPPPPDGDGTRPPGTP
jgi:hypothetical protein